MGMTTQAQTLVPLIENSTITRHRGEQEKAYPEAWLNQLYATDAKGLQDCELETAGINYLLPGNSFTARVNIDTSDAGGGSFVCTNCNSLNFGGALLSGDTLRYTAFTGVIAGKDSVQVKYCDANGANCTDSLYVYFVVRRAGRKYFPPQVTLQSEASITLNADATLLPGPLTCNYFIACPSDYDGRDQRAYFTEYPAPVSSFVYEASRFSGVDSVCVALCDTFSICDIYHFSIRVQHDTIGLPFMDDFSYAGPDTDNRLWLDSDVFVNQTMSELPPSVGVATFDGVNSRGRPYGGDPGEADRLTSTYINLNGVSGNVTLTYWLQRRGLGDRPEIRDSIVLEFRLPNGQWVQRNFFEGAPASQPNTAVELFGFHSEPVPLEFRHKAFQFRFKNYADRQGVLDNWNLDYIRLDNIQTDMAFNDIAFTKLPQSILKDYTSMPWRHFKGNEAALLSPTIEVGVYNHAGQALSATPSSVLFVEENTGIQPFGAPITLFNGLDANILNGTNIERSYALGGDASGFPNVFAGYLTTMQNPAFDAPEQLDFSMQYNLSSPSQINQPGFEAVQANDQVVHTTVFEEYFSYDDGSAEAGLIASEGGQIAVRFRANVEDTLRAVRFHFPHTNSESGDQTFRLRVWVGTLDNSPEYDALLAPVYADTYFDTLQGFTTYPLMDGDGALAPLHLPVGDFFVGWQQVTSCDFTRCVAVGYDKNRPEGKPFIFRNGGTTWTDLPASTPAGALMIRPVVGDETPGATATDEVFGDANFSVKLFPNPAQDRVQIQLPNGQDHEYRMALYNSFGQVITQGPLQTSLDVSTLPSGLYFLHVLHRDGKQRSVNKLLIAR